MNESIKEEIESIFKKHWKIELKDKNGKPVSYQFALGYKLAVKLLSNEIQKIIK